MLKIHNAVPRDDVLLGIVRADFVEMGRYPTSFDTLLERLLATRTGTLGEKEESRRAGARDILRNGSYKPTGRGKPASEYLLRAASEPEYTLPRINGPVDICNYLSLREVLPISLWDLDRARTEQFVFRLGRSGESYVFNDGGQAIDVEDLLVGCRVPEHDDSGNVPIVNPVRDSLETKTTPQSKRVAACIYTPAVVVSGESLLELCREFASLLSECGTESDVSYAVANPGSSIEV